jgi:pSer/pThr/pTyr-binding forkhead associated (FHA) protein
MMTHLAENWISWLGGVIAVVLAIWLIIFAIRKHRTAKKNRIPFLILTELDGRLSSYQLTGTAATLGRGSHNDVVFKNDSVSSNHAQIHLRRDGAVYITDLLSSNGVYVNGERVTEHELRSGDVLELGEVRLNVHINQERS